MHFAPSMTKIVDEAQVEFVCASGVRESCAAFLEEGHLAILTEGGKQRRYKTGNEVLRNNLLAHMGIHGDYAYLVLTDIGRSVPVIQVTVPKIKLQPLGTPT